MVVQDASIRQRSDYRVGLPENKPNFSGQVLQMVLKLEVFVPLKTRWSLQNCFTLLLEQ
jgi:hypothetical protein